MDKGKAAAVTTVVYTKEKSSGRLIFENQSTVFLRGSGGFGGKKQGKGECPKQSSSDHRVKPVLPDRGAASANNTPPKRTADAVVEEKTLSSQAALYRLSGDYNPLHVSRICHCDRKPF